MLVSLNTPELETSPRKLRQTPANPTTIHANLRMAPNLTTNREVRDAKIHRADSQRDPHICPKTQTQLTRSIAFAESQRSERPKEALIESPL